MTLAALEFPNSKQCARGAHFQMHPPLDHRDLGSESEFYSFWPWFLSNKYPRKSDILRSGVYVLFFFLFIIHYAFFLTGVTYTLERHLYHFFFLLNFILIVLICPIFIHFQRWLNPIFFWVLFWLNDLILFLNDKLMLIAIHTPNFWKHSGKKH